MLTETLAALDTWLRANTPVTAASLRPPATEADLDAAEQALGFQLPEELHQLYLWHDGTVGLLSPAPFDIQPSLYLLPLEGAVTTHSRLSSLHRAMATRDEDWQPHWLPITADDCGGHTVIETKGPHNGRLFYLSDEDGPHYHQAWPSLHDWANALTHSLTTSEPFMSYHIPQITDGALTWKWIKPPKRPLPTGFELPRP